VPPLGKFRVGTSAPVIVGHLTAHCGQIHQILQARGML
jgi:hypothetical protein